MARINIEDTLFKEKSFEKLLIKLGSKRAALGALVEAFILAQKWYKSTASDRLIPQEEWDREEIAKELVEVGYAEIREKGVYLRGSEDQFGWLIQRQEAGAKGGAKKAENRLATASDRLPDVSGLYPLTLTPSLSPSLSLSQSPALFEKNTLSSETEHQGVIETFPAASGQGGWRCLLKIYNDNRGTLPEAKAWNKDREKKAQARWKELPDEEQWIKVVKYFASSAWHTGWNERGWVASFGFILQQGRWLEAAEKSGIAPRNKSHAREMNNLNALDEALKIIGEQK